MRRYRVVVTSFAAANIHEAHAWLSAKNPVYADRWLAAIREKILSLDTLPESPAVARESAAFDVEIGVGRPGHALESVLHGPGIGGSRASRSARRS